MRLVSCFLALTLAALFGACSSDDCTETPGLFVRVQAPELPGTVASLRFVVTVDGVSRTRAFDLDQDLNGRETSVEIFVGPIAGDSARVSVFVTGHASAQGGGPALGSASDEVTVGKDACVGLSLSLGGAGSDAGVDAGPNDVGPSDVGPNDVGPGDSGLDAGVDAGPEDMGLDDTGLFDTGVDAGPSNCSDNVASGNEVCDGTDLAGETCFSRGFRNGTLACNGTCDGFDTSGCGAAINSTGALLGAIGEAYNTAGHELIRVPAGNYGGGELSIDECSGGCPSGGPDGVTLRPLDGEVIITMDRFEVRSGNNVFEDLIFSNMETGLRLTNDSGDDSGDNQLVRLLLSSNDGEANYLLDVESDNNQILACRFVNSSSSQIGGLRIRNARGNTAAMNVFYGTFSVALTVFNLDSTSQAQEATRLDHNSVWLRNASSTALSMTTANNVCARGNVFFGTSTSTGTVLSGAALGGNCPGGASGNNVNLNHQFPCSGADCALCNGSGPLCDRTTDPGFDQAPTSEREWLCLRPSPGNGLVDQALDLGYDMVDGDPATFLGVAPEVGAREVGTSRAYGTRPTTCP